MSNPPKPQMKIEMMPLADLLEMRHERNPKEHDLDSLIASFKRFGFTAAPTIDEATATMVAGHGRCEALEMMRVATQPPPAGVEERGTTWFVPVVRGISFKSERERDAYVIADNQNVMAGGWKFDVLAQLLGDIKNDGGFDGLGFEKIELDALLGQLPPESPNDGFDPESQAPGGGPRDDDNRGRTQITARVECPNCKHVFER